MASSVPAPAKQVSHRQKILYQRHNRLSILMCLSQLEQAWVPMVTAVSWMGRFAFCYYVIVIRLEHFRTFFLCHWRDSKRLKLLLEGKWTVAVSSRVLRKHYDSDLHITNSWVLLCEGQNGTTDLEATHLLYVGWTLEVLWRIVRLRIFLLCGAYGGQKGEAPLIHFHACCMWEAGNEDNV